MLTQETKRHIDAARQVLVGVVPNPTSQIDQIPNALIYKFMDDMDSPMPSIPRRDGLAAMSSGSTLALPLSALKTCGRETCGDGS